MIRNYRSDDPDPLRDGEVLRIPLNLMDARHRNDADDTDDGGAADAAARELADARRAAADARERYIQRVTNAWRTPSSPAPAVRSPSMRSDAKPISITPGSLAEARRLADEAWQRKQERVRNAWKGRV